MPNGSGRKANGVNANNNNGNGRPNGSKNGMAKRKPWQPVTRSMTSNGVMITSQNQRPLIQGMQTFSGSDFLGVVNVKAAPSTAERVLQMFPISPSFYPGTRLTQLSQLWERYRFRSFRIRYVPAVPTTIACQFVLYLDTDPSDDPSVAIDSDVLIRQATAHAGAQQWNFNTPKIVPLPMRSDDQLYYTGDTKLNERLNLMGKAYLIQVTDPLNFNGDPVVNDLIAGSLYIDWTCAFQLAQINPAGYGLRDNRVTFGIATGTVISATPYTFTWTGLLPNKAYILWVLSSLCDFDSTTVSRVFIYQPSQLREGVEFHSNAASADLVPGGAASGARPLARDICTIQTNSQGSVLLALDCESGTTTIDTNSLIVAVRSI